MDRAQLDRWMTAAAEGDRAALDPLFGALWPAVTAYATRFLGGDAALAEDCAQEALVRLFAQLDRYDRDRDALTWALTFATWECRTARRRRQRRAEAPAASIPDGGPLSGASGAAGGVPGGVPGGVVDGVALAEERALVRAAIDALAALPARDRDVIAAAVTDDDELRRALPPATFRKRLERALGRLRLSWRSRHGIP